MKSQVAVLLHPLEQLFTLSAYIVHEAVRQRHGRSGKASDIGDEL